MRYTTRVAPSPTGDFHLGTARTAYFNWLAARASGGKFILRIDDTDKERNVDGAVDVILDAMDWLGLDYDEIHFQSERKSIYENAATYLEDIGLTNRADNGAVLLNAAYPSGFTDSITGHQQPPENSTEMLTQQVLIKGDGMPTYHFATCVDDIGMGVNWIIRGMDHFTNTHRHSTITVALGADIPLYTHVGLIMLNKKKMSKRDAAASLLGLRDAGYDKDAVLNFILRMGWGPSVDDKSTSVLTVGNALELFLDGGKMRSAPSGYDQAKLDSFNKKHKAMKRKTQ